MRSILEILEILGILGILGILPETAIYKRMSCNK